MRFARLMHQRGHAAQEVLLDAAPTALTYCMLAHDAFNQHPTRKELLVGLSNGAMNQVFVDATTHHFGATLQSADRRGAINQLFSAFDMTGSGMNEIAVGREDGRFEVYDMDTEGTLQLVRRKPSTVLLARGAESVTCVHRSRADRPADHFAALSVADGR